VKTSAIQAPGWPGAPARWTSSAKSGVGTSLGELGHLWFTLSHGIVNEVYYPRVDQACTRDLGLIVTDGKDFFSEEKRDASFECHQSQPGVPAFNLLNTSRDGRYRIEKEIIADPVRPVLLQRVRFVPLENEGGDYRLFALLAPHLGDGGGGNTAWAGDFKGVPFLFAEKGGTALALACSIPWANRTVGFVGSSDGWQDLKVHRRLTASYERADNGNVALTGEIALPASGEPFVLALGFGRTSGEAAHRALGSLWDGFDAGAKRYAHDWQTWQRTLRPLDQPKLAKDLYRVSTAVLRTHESDLFPGGGIASLSIPWGSSKGDGDLGGYHLVWPRDLVESAGALLAAGAAKEVHRALRYLAVTQEEDGHWPQNMWLDGSPFWNGIQMDETGFPILLVDLTNREGLLDAHQMSQLWPMVRRAAGFIVKNGPATPLDRWEEDPGYSPFTLAVEVAALLAAAGVADQCEPALAAYLRETADAWNSDVERQTYVTNTPLAREVGVEGYYVRIASPHRADGAAPRSGVVEIKNRAGSGAEEPVTHVVSPDALALVRFGLRAATDPRILNTVKVIDALLKVDTPRGPLWHRYNGDGYGEHEDGSGFDGTGIGRGWPLLTGERAHFELAAGHREAAMRLLETLAEFANDGGLLPEQTWDAADIPSKELFFSRPAGSAMPLVWAHAEYVKLRRSLADGRVFDMPLAPVQRYQKDKVQSHHVIWRFSAKRRTLASGKILRIEVLAPARVHWSSNDWQSTTDSASRDTGLGLHVVDLATDRLQPGATVRFTFWWPDAQRWEGNDFAVGLASPGDKR
jgi:glucoamylase